LSILRITLHAIIRNPRRILTLGLGIILVTAFITGVFLSIDYRGQELLTEILKHVDVDFEIAIAHENVSKYMDIVRELEGIDGIEIVEPYTVEPYEFPYAEPFLYHVGYELRYTITKGDEQIYPLYRNVTTGYGTYREPAYFLYVYGFRQNMSIGEIKVLEGTLNLTGNNIAVTKEMAEKLNLKIGDKLVFTLLSTFKKANVTICAIIEFKGKLKELIVDRHSIFAEEQVMHMVVPIEFAWSFFERRFGDFYTGGSSPSAGYGFWVNYWVFIDREKFLNPWDPDQSVKRLRRLEVEIRNVCIKNKESFEVENHLEYVIEVFSRQLDFLKKSVGFSSLPIFFLAWFFVLISNWVSVNERRREIGLLKIRGATNKQIFASIFLETLIIGSIGGVLGVGLGYLISIYFAEFFAEKSITSIPLRVVFRFLPFYTQFSVILGIVFSCLAVIFPVRKIMKMDAQKLLQEYLEEVEAEKWKPKLTLILFMVGLIKTIEMVLGLSIAKIAVQMEFYLRNIVISLLFMVLIFIDLILYFLGPIFLIYGFSKIVTHYAPRFSKPFKAIVKPLLGELSDVVVKNFTRKATRTARIMFLLAITLSYGVTMIVGPASARHHAMEVTKIDVGADVKASQVFPINETELIRNISSIEGVNLIATTRECQYVASIEGEYTELFIVDENYFNVSYIREEYLEGASIEEVYSKFRSGENCCIISKYLSREYLYDVGDEIRISFTAGGNRIAMDLTIIAIAKVLPGLTWTIQPYFSIIIAISYQCAQKYFDPQKVTPIQLLIDTVEGTNNTKLAEKLEEEYTEIRSATSPEQEIQKRLNDPISVFFFKLFQVQVIFAFLIAAVGLSLVMTMATLEREREIGLLIARGISREQAVKIFLGEALLITVISFTLGIAEGLSVTYGVFKSTMPMIPEITDYPIKTPPVFPINFYLLIIVGFTALLLTSIVPAWHLTRKTLAKILRIHH